MERSQWVNECALRRQHALEGWASWTGEVSYSGVLGLGTFGAAQSLDQGAFNKSNTYLPSMRSFSYINQYSFFFNTALCRVTLLLVVPLYPSMCSFDPPFYAIFYMLRFVTNIAVFRTSVSPYLTAWPILYYIYYIGSLTHTYVSYMCIT